MKNQLENADRIHGFTAKVNVRRKLCMTLRGHHILI